MRGGVIFLIIALLLAYVAVTGRYKCFAAFLTCIFTGDCGCAGVGGGQSVAAAGLPALPTLPNVGSSAVTISPAQIDALEAVDKAPVDPLYITPQQRAALEAIDRGRP